MPEVRRHHYAVTLDWTGNRGSGTSAYAAYSRDHEIAAPGRPAILGSSDAAFRGDAARWNPEQLLVASLASCHQLWYLHLCADAGISVIAYRDQAEGIMAEDVSGSGRFVRVILRPSVTIAAGGDTALAMALHAEAHAKCFIANSVGFPVDHMAVVLEESLDPT
jgi:organic hydroperoxide reductase OsmC/OhrA